MNAALRIQQTIGISDVQSNDGGTERKQTSEALV